MAFDSYGTKIGLPTKGDGELTRYESVPVEKLGLR